MPNIIKKATEISRNEWVLWIWVDVTLMNGEEVVYLRGRMRPIEDSIEAGNQFDAWIDNYKMTIETPDDK